MNRYAPFAACRLAGLLGLFSLAATTASAAPPQIAYLEKAQTQASENQIRSYGVPTTDSAGKLFYWDVTVDLAIDATGKPNPNAAVTSIKQVKVATSRIVPGTYTDPWGGTCIVTESLLPSGRQEAAITCRYNTGNWINLGAVNGTIAGHPFELQLVAAKIGDITGYRDYLWGVVGSLQWSVAYGTCFSQNHLVALRQVGTQITVTNFGVDNISDCGMTLTRKP
jgi:hypothetical protein